MIVNDPNCGAIQKAKEYSIPFQIVDHKQFAKRSDFDTRMIEKLDKYNCVTHSKNGIDYIRNKIGFKNLIITDDICMKALRYSLKENIQN